MEICQGISKIQEEVAKAREPAPEDTRQFAEKEIHKIALMANELMIPLPFA